MTLSSLLREHQQEIYVKLSEFLLSRRVCVCVCVCVCLFVWVGGGMGAGGREVE